MTGRVNKFMDFFPKLRAQAMRDLRVDTALALHVENVLEFYSVEEDSENWVDWDSGWSEDVMWEVRQQLRSPQNLRQNLLVSELAF